MQMRRTRRSAQHKTQTTLSVLFKLFTPFFLRFIIYPYRVGWNTLPTFSRLSIPSLCSFDPRIRDIENFLINKYHHMPRVPDLQHFPIKLSKSCEHYSP